MIFYIASGLENAANVRKAAEILKSLGHEQSYDWTVHGDVRAQGAQRLLQVAKSESEAIMRSDLVLVLLPGARGTHTELGLAIGSAHPGERIWVWSQTGEHFASDERTCAFYWHPCVRRFTGAFDGVVQAIEQEFSHNTPVEGE